MSTAQGNLFAAPTLTPADLAILREALRYTLAMLSRGCPYAPDWTDEQIVAVAGPLQSRLKGATP
ncbi:MAG: hypothetical protein HY784_19140 [Chloroflexi bacterium]|nr:hypothetical protein [Chloroflexota bacterium]